MEKTLKIISKTLSNAVVGLVVVLAVLLAGVRLLGFTPYIVLSGSMEPIYHVGSMIYVSKVDPMGLETGDPITYRMTSGVVVTHRIVEVLNPGTPNLSFRTKGDANDIADETPIPASAVIGKPCFTIPYLGFISDFVQRPKGLILVIGTGATLMLMSFAVDMLLSKPGKEETLAESSALPEQTEDES